MMCRTPATPCGPACGVRCWPIFGPAPIPLAGPEGTTTVRLSTPASARTAAFDARANESLGLVRRGQAGASETLWKARDAEVDAQLTALGKLTWFGGSGSAAQLGTGWKAYRTAHAEVRALDDAGTWDAAVAKATSATESPRTSFAAFEKASSEAVAGFEKALLDDVRGPAARALVGALVALLAGLAAAVLATRGIAKRVEEYR